MELADPIRGSKERSGARLRLAHHWLIALVAVFAQTAIAQSNTSDLNAAAKNIAMAATLPEYDFASIHKRRYTAKDDSALDTVHGGIVIKNASLAEIIEFAYNIASFDLISRLPESLSVARFDINAKITDSAGVPAKLTEQQLRAMVIPLLAARFHLRARLSPKRLTVYELIVADGGPKFKLYGPDAAMLTARWGREKNLIFHRASMPALAGVLSDSGLGHLVVDRTGLTGAGDFSLCWVSDEVEAHSSDDHNLSPIFTAVQDQLGLKLRPVKAVVDTLVIDHVEEPSEN